MKGNGKMKRIMVLLLAFIMIASLLAACSGGENNSQNNSGSKTQNNTGNTPANEDPTDISVMMAFWSKEPPRTDAAIQAIEEHTNSNIEITWVPASGYDEKLNATIASGTHPKLMVVNDLKSSVIVNSVQSGMFWELGPYLKDYENLSQLNEISLKNTAIDGKTYGLPRERVVTRNGVIIRKDWLDNLGLSEPTTLDEFYEMIHAFVHDDPDQNGQDDTLGITEDKTLWLFDQVLGSMGGSNKWKVEADGSFTPAFTEQAYLETMNFAKKLVDEGMLNNDFAIYPNRNDDFNNSKTGIIVSVLDSALSASYADLKELSPDSELTVISRLEGPGGEGLIGGSGANGAFMIPKTSVANEEELHKVLSFMDGLVDPEMLELFGWGIEGKHFEKDGDKKSFTDKNAYVDEVDPLTQFVFMGYNYLYTQQAQSELSDKIEQMWQENESVAIMNPAQPLISQTHVEKGTELDKIISDAQVKYILGEIDESQWNEAIEQWKSNGGDQIAEEYAAEHAKLTQ